MVKIYQLSLVSTNVMTRLYACYLTRTHASVAFNIKYFFKNIGNAIFSLVIQNCATLRFNTVVFERH